MQGVARASDVVATPVGMRRAKRKPAITVAKLSTQETRSHKQAKKARTTLSLKDIGTSVSSHQDLLEWKKIVFAAHTGAYPLCTCAGHHNSNLHQHPLLLLLTFTVSEIQTKV